MNIFTAFWGRSSRQVKKPSRRRFQLEPLEQREVMAADLPILMVIADQQDFYWQEYGHTRQSLEAAGIEAEVAATTTQPSTPHPSSGQGADGGIVVPDVALADVDADNYSAIVFVGGWGASSYQYAFSGTYGNAAYNGDVATKSVVNHLINDFAAQDKYIAAICHAVTVLAWARVDGVSPLNGRTVSVPWIGAPAVTWQGHEYGNFELMQYPQVIENGGIANTVSGQYGDPMTVNDDVVVDGKIITAENYDAALAFGEEIAARLLATPQPPPVNHAPLIADQQFSVWENTVAGAVVGQVAATDPDAGQSLTYSIAAGNTNGAFAINAATGMITVANAAALDFETHPSFQLTVQVSDNGEPPLSAAGVINISLLDIAESAANTVRFANGELTVTGGDGADQIYLWTTAGCGMMVWLNGVTSGPFAVGGGLHTTVFGGDSNDQIFATDTWTGVRVFGDGGHDLITGGHADNELHGGDGVDRIWAGAGNDLIFGEAGNDVLDGGLGNDVVVGGADDDWMTGFDGNDVLIGGAGGDRLDGGAGDDLLIGGRTTYDADAAALAQMLAVWTANPSLADRRATL